jgi:homoserine O-acetyltransferase
MKAARATALLSYRSYDGCHNAGRLRGGVEKALAFLNVKTLLVGIGSDVLFPVDELKFMHIYIPNSQYAELSSVFGHDGFLLESEQLSITLRNFLT